MGNSNREDIVNELNQCREDERSAQNQILQAVMIIVSVLGVIFTASLFRNDDTGGQSLSVNKWGEHCLFYLSVCVFMVGFTYVATVGILNLLRFHYMRDLEDRLARIDMDRKSMSTKDGASVVPGSSDQKQDTDDKLTDASPEKADYELLLVQWMNLSAAITTRNPFHLKLPYAKFYFIDLTLTAFFVFLFSAIIVAAQFLMIGSKWLMDDIFAVLAFVVILIILTAFGLVSVRGEDMYQSALYYSAERKKDRIKSGDPKGRTDKGSKLEKNKRNKNKKNKNEKNKNSDREDNDSTQNNVNSKNRTLKDVFFYFFYPKCKDLQKLLIIGSGFVTGLLIRSRNASQIYLEFVNKKDYVNLLITFLILEFLMYQARYLLNDIRGLPEDVESGAVGRLPVDVINAECAVHIALTIIIVRVFLAVVLTLSLKEARTRLLSGIIAIGLVSILYEAARTAKKNKCIFLLVSLGYPLRFVFGLWAAIPDLEQLLWKQITFDQTIAIACLVISYGFMGEFTVLMEWAHEAASRYQEGKSGQKSYYKPLFDRLLKNAIQFNNARIRCNTTFVEEEDKRTFVEQDYVLPEYPFRFRGKIGDGWNVAFLASVLLLSISLWLSGKVPFVSLILEIVTLVIVFLLCNHGQRILNVFFGITIFSQIIKVFFYSRLVTSLDSFALLIYIHQLVFIVLYYFLRIWDGAEFNILDEAVKCFWVCYKCVVGDATWKYLHEEEISK